MGVGGAGMMAWGHEHDVMFMAAGSVVMLLGAMLATACIICQAIRVCMRPASDAYEQGWQAGFDKGYWEGRRTARPVVVPLGAPEDQEVI